MLLLCVWQCQNADNCFSHTHWEQMWSPGLKTLFMARRMGSGLHGGRMECPISKLKELRSITEIQLTTTSPLSGWSQGTPPDRNKLGQPVCGSEHPKEAPELTSRCEGLIWATNSVVKVIWDVYQPKKKGTVVKLQKVYFMILRHLLHREGRCPKEFSRSLYTT